MLTQVSLPAIIKFLHHDPHLKYNEKLVRLSQACVYPCDCESKQTGRQQNLEFGRTSMWKGMSRCNLMYIFILRARNNRPPVPLRCIIISSFSGTKRLGRALEHFPPSRAKVKNALTIFHAPITFLPSFLIFDISEVTSCRTINIWRESEMTLCSHVAAMSDVIPHETKPPLCMPAQFVIFLLSRVELFVCWPI